MWYVMRDLKRANAKQPAYRMLREAGYTVFTPMTTRIVVSGTRRQRVEVPVIPDLLFVDSERSALDKTVELTPTLQYRYVRGGYCVPMTVPEREMQRFIAAVTFCKTPRYYRPEELTPAMIGARIRMVCEGPLNGVEGTLLKIRGSGKKRLLVKLAGLLAAAVEVGAADYVEILGESDESDL